MTHTYKQNPFLPTDTVCVCIEECDPDQEHRFAHCEVCGDMWDLTEGQCTGNHDPNHLHYQGRHQGDEIDCDACAENHTESVIDGSYVSDEWTTHSKFDADQKLIPSDEGTINCPMCEHWIG